MNNFGEYIREKRETYQENDKSFSLRQVAQRLDIQPSYLSKIERGLELPSEELIIKISKMYEENEDTLLAMAGKVSSRLQKIILKNPTAFSILLSSLENSPEHAILRVVREVKDGNW